MTSSRRHEVIGSHLGIGTYFCCTLLVNSEIRELSGNSDKIFNSTTPFFSDETVDIILPLSSNGMNTKFQAIVLHLQLFIYTCV